MSRPADDPHRVLAEGPEDFSEQQQASSSSRALISSRNPSWLPATHLLVPSSRMTSAVCSSLGFMASMSLVNRSASFRSKPLFAVNTQWLNAGETHRHFSPLDLIGLVLGQVLPHPLADDPRLPSALLECLEDMDLARAGIAAQVNLAIQAEES